MLGLGTFTLSTLSGFLSPLSCCYLSQRLNVTSSRLLGHPSFTRSLILVHGITLSPSLVVSPPYPQFCILRFNQQQIQNIQGKNPRKFQNTQQLNGCSIDNYHVVFLFSRDIDKIRFKYSPTSLLPCGRPEASERFLHIP